MSWDRNWEDDAAVDEQIAKDAEERKEKRLDDEGYQILGFRERIYRALAMIIFAIIFPFVFVFLGLYRLFSAVSLLTWAKPVTAAADKTE